MSNSIKQLERQLAEEWREELRHTAKSYNLIWPEEL